MVEAVLHLSALAGAHEEGVAPQALGQTPATGAGAVRRLPTGVADHGAAPQVVLVVSAARTVSALQEVEVGGGGESLNTV